MPKSATRTNNRLCLEGVICAEVFLREIYTIVKCIRPQNDVHQIEISNKIAFVTAIIDKDAINPKLFTPATHPQHRPNIPTFYPHTKFRQPPNVNCISSVHWDNPQPRCFMHV